MGGDQPPGLHIYEKKKIHTRPLQTRGRGGRYVGKKATKIKNLKKLWPQLEQQQQRAESSEGGWKNYIKNALSE